jgi:hypothetical protein
MVAPLICGLILIAPKANATAGVVLTITPTSVQPLINPGATFSGSFQVINQGSDTYSVIIYGAPYSVKTENYSPDFVAIPGQPNVSDWFKFSIVQATIQPTQSQTVNYTISVPSGTQPGGYYAAAFAETQSPPNASGVIIKERVGEIFYIRVAGAVPQSGKLLTWSVPFWQTPPITSTIRLEDSGGYNYASNVQVVVRDIFGNPKYTLTTLKEVLPHTIRRIIVSWPQSPSLGLFKVTGYVSILGKNQTLSTKYVLVMSSTVKKVTLIVVIAIIIVVILTFIIRRKRQPKRPTIKK